MKTINATNMRNIYIENLLSEHVESKIQCDQEMIYKREKRKNGKKIRIVSLLCIISDRAAKIRVFDTNCFA